VEIDMKDLDEILQRASASLPPEDFRKLKAAIETLGWLQGEISHKDASLGRLRKLIFGTPTTEKTSQVLGDGDQKAPEGTDEKEDPPQAPSDASKPASAAKGHGRNGAGAYAGAQRVSVPHETLKAGDPCPQNGCEGKLYRLPQPRVLVCVKGHVPLSATVYEREALRCALCGKVFVAGLPDGLHPCKYDPTATAMIGLLKYGTGMPFYRLGGLQELGIAQAFFDVQEAAFGACAVCFKDLVGPENRVLDWAKKRKDSLPPALPGVYRFPDPRPTAPPAASPPKVAPASQPSQSPQPVDRPAAEPPKAPVQADGSARNPQLRAVIAVVIVLLVLAIGLSLRRRRV
jgi:hypothetical protein